MSQNLANILEKSLQETADSFIQVIQPILNHVVENQIIYIIIASILAAFGFGKKAINFFSHIIDKIRS